MLKYVINCSAAGRGRGGRLARFCKAHNGVIILLRGLEDDALPGFAGAEDGSRSSQVALNSFCEWVRATKHAPGNPFRLRERRHGLAEIVERRARVLVKCPRVNFPHL